MNKEAIDALIEKNPKLLSHRAKLETMVPGNYCLHRSWGFGKIVDYNAADDRLSSTLRMVSKVTQWHPLLRG